MRYSMSMERAPRSSFAAHLLPARPICRMHHGFEIVVHADVRLAVATTEHAIQVRRPVVLVLAVEVHDVVAEVGDLLRDGELRFAATQRFLGVATHGDVANEADEARRLGALALGRRRVRRRIRFRRVASRASSRPMPMMRGSPASM